MKWSFARSSKEAKELGSTLLLEGHIKMVNMHLLERSGSFSCCSTDQGELVDSRSQYYIFVGPIHPPLAALMYSIVSSSLSSLHLLMSGTVCPT